MELREIFPVAKPCGWCLTETSSTLLYGTPTCSVCANVTAKERTNRWLQAVNQKRRDRGQ